MTLTATTTHAEYSLDTINNLSVDLLTHLESRRVEVGAAVLGLVLSLARVSSQAPLDDDQEMAFVEGLMEWLSAYWTAGEVS